MESYSIWSSEDDLGLDANLFTAGAVGCDVSDVDNTQSFDKTRREACVKLLLSGKQKSRLHSIHQIYPLQTFSKILYTL
jgi:hypothetical protein